MVMLESVSSRVVFLDIIKTWTNIIICILGQPMSIAVTFYNQEGIELLNI